MSQGNRKKKVVHVEFCLCAFSCRIKHLGTMTQRNSFSGIQITLIIYLCLHPTTCTLGTNPFMSLHAWLPSLVGVIRTFLVSIIIVLDILINVVPSNTLKCPFS